MTGETITWRTVHGPASGVVETVQGDRLIVRLPSGKQVIVHKESVRK